MKLLSILAALALSLPASAQSLSVPSEQATPDELVVTAYLLAASPVGAHVATTRTYAVGPRVLSARTVLRTRGELHLNGGSEEFRAGKAIVLEPGFSVDSSTRFIAVIAEAPVDRPTLADSSAVLATEREHTDERLMDSDQATHAEESARRAYVRQNEPNPASDVTVIRYFLPDGSAYGLLQVFDLSGQEIYREDIHAIGNGQSTLSLRALPAGTYIYHLLVDGQFVGSRKLLVVH